MVLTLSKRAHAGTLSQARRNRVGKARKFVNGNGEYEPPNPTYIEMDIGVTRSNSDVCLWPEY
jgi:hypothetical protein